MKKILSILLLITSFGYSQTLLKLKAIEYAPGSNYCTVTNSLGVQTYTPCSAVVGLLPSTTSITINGTTKSFTSTPTFTVGDLFSTSTYSNPSWLSALAWSKITGTPTTLSGYGITDGVLNTSSITINGSSQLLSGSSFSVGNLNGSPTANYILKGVSSSSVTNSSILENSDHILFTQNNISLGGLPTATAIPSIHLEYPRTAQNYALASNAGVTYVNGSNGVSFAVSGTVKALFDASSFQTLNPFTVGTTLASGSEAFRVTGESVIDGAIKLPQQTASRVLTTDGSTYVTSSSVTTTELGYLSGVTNSVQTQFNEKENIVSGISTLGVDNYTVTYSPAITAYTAGFKALVTFTAANTTTATINFNGLGVKNIVKGVSTSLVSGDITAGASYWLLYDGTNFVLINSTLVNQKTNYSPTFTGLLSAPSLSFAYYIEQDKFFILRVGFSANATGSGTTRAMTLPFTVTETHQFTLPLIANGTFINGSARATGGTNTLNFYPSTIGSSFVDGQSFNITLNLTFTK